MERRDRNSVEWCWGEGYRLLFSVLIMERTRSEAFFRAQFFSDPLEHTRSERIPHNYQAVCLPVSEVELH